MSSAAHLAGALAGIRARRTEDVLVDEIAHVYHQEGCHLMDGHLAEVNVVDAKLMGAEACRYCCSNRKQ